MKKLTITMMQQTLNKQDRRLTVGLDLRSFSIIRQIGASLAIIEMALD